MHRSAWYLATAMALTMAAAPAWGQTLTDEPIPSSMGASSSRPFRGLFRGASAVDDRRHSLDASGSLFAAHIRNVAGGESAVLDPRANLARTYQGANGRLQYAYRWDNASVGAFAQGGMAYVPEYRDTGDEWVNRWSLGADGSYSRELGPRSRVSTAGAVRYSPYFGLGGNLFGFGSGTISSPQYTPGLDDVLTRSPSVQMSGRASYNRELSRRSSLEAYYLTRLRDYIGGERIEDDWQEHAAGVSYRRRFGRYAGVRAGYRYRVRNYAVSELGWLGFHEFDLGLDGGYGFGRSYAIDRRTTFSFDVRPTAFLGERYRARETPPGEPLSVTSDTRLRLFLGGHADLTRTMGRTWAARVAYDRSAGYQDGLDRVVTSDMASAAIGGLVGSRLDLSVSAVYASGRVGFSGVDRGFSRAVGSAHARYAITRFVAAYAQYFYYHYVFREGVVLPGGLPPRLDRQGVSGGLTVHLPLL